MGMNGVARLSRILSFAVIKDQISELRNNDLTTPVFVMDADGSLIFMHSVKEPLNHIEIMTLEKTNWNNKYRLHSISYENTVESYLKKRMNEVNLTRVEKEMEKCNNEQVRKLDIIVWWYPGRPNMTTITKGDIVSGEGTSPFCPDKVMKALRKLFKTAQVGEFVTENGAKKIMLHKIKLAD